MKNWKILVFSATVCAFFVQGFFVYTNFGDERPPITLSDENTGGSIRQLLFLSAAGVAGMAVFFTRSIHEILFFRLREGLIGALLLGSTIWSTDKVLTLKRSNDTLSRSWEKWLKGGTPTITVTFDQDAASENAEAVHLRPESRVHEFCRGSLAAPDEYHRGATQTKY